MKVSTRIDFSEEDVGPEGYVDEVSISRTVEDLDPHDWLWYLLRLSELAGYDVKDLKIVMNNGKLYETDW
jgi:hypothetical protein